jgi:hypothetical protein
MPEPGGSEVVRLSLPPDADLRLVVEVAVAALVRRAGRSDDAIQAARLTARTCLAEVADQAGRERIEIEIDVVEDRLEVRVHAGGIQQSVMIPVAPGPPG